MNSLMVLADGSVLGIRDTDLPASNDEIVITFCLYGVKFQNKVGASPAVRGMLVRETTAAREYYATSNEREQECAPSLAPSTLSGLQLEQHLAHVDGKDGGLFDSKRRPVWLRHGCVGNQTAHYFRR